MAGGFFEMRCAHDLLDKLERDLLKLQEFPSGDTLFNFFVTGGSLRDWIQIERSDLRGQLKILYDGELKHCLEISNKAKHYVLENGRTAQRPDPDTAILSWGALNSAPLNTHPFNDGGERWHLSYDGHIAVEDVFAYATMVLDQLRAFFVVHDIRRNHDLRSAS